MTVQEVIDALEKVQDKSKLVTTGETGGTIIQVIDTDTYAFLNKAIYGRINDTGEDSEIMEWKIGEIKQVNGEWYQCVRFITCNECGFNNSGCTADKHITGDCDGRLDGSSVIFKKLEKVGEPYNIGKKVFQRYEVFTKPYIFNDEFFTINTPVDDSFISIEIKQNEDMEECNNTNLSNSESIGKNLKPFDLQAAKSGKPVCTRDGRKARILCYDFKQNDEYPLLVAVENIYGKECPLLYSNDGICDNYKESNCELAMLPEKKEGWVNVYDADTTFRFVEGMVYNTKDEAIQRAKEEVTNGQREKNEYVDTVKICWEE